MERSSGRQSKRRPLAWNSGPPDLVALLPRLELTIGQLSRLTDLSVRQISYWTDKGLLSATNPKKRLYSHLALRKALYMKQALNVGLPLAEAGERAEEQLQRDLAVEQQEKEMAANSSRSFLLAKLDELEALARRLRQSLPTIEQEGLEQEARLTRTKLEVVGFFARNPFAQDTAARLATHLGRTADLVAAALDELAAEQAIEQMNRDGMVVCRLPRPRSNVVRLPRAGRQE